MSAFKADSSGSGAHDDWLDDCIASALNARAHLSPEHQYRSRALLLERARLQALSAAAPPAARRIERIAGASARRWQQTVHILHVFVSSLMNDEAFCRAQRHAYQMRRVQDGSRFAYIEMALVL